jgi:hypothetical protein
MEKGVDGIAVQELNHEVMVADVALNELGFTNLASSGTAQRNQVDKLSRTTTSSPASSNSNTIWLPMNPAPPVTRIVMLQIVSRDVVAIHRFLSERD